MRRFLTIACLSLSGLVPVAYAAAQGDIGLPADYNATKLQLSGLDGATPDSQLPAQFDWRTYGMVSTPKDQGSCGACWAFASTGVYESKLLMQGYSSIDISEQQQLSCNTQMSGCAGGSMASLRYWESRLAIRESCSPYTASATTTCPEATCTATFSNAFGYYTVDMSNRNDIKRSILDDGPAYFRYDFYNDFYTFWDNSANAGAAYIQSGNNRNGGHAVLVIGWDDNRSAWLCKNSWGATDGPNGDGTFWMAYSGHGHDLAFGVGNIRIHSHSIKPEFYLSLNGDVSGYYGNQAHQGFWHWRNFGVTEGRHSSPAFDLPFYYGVNEAVASWFQTYPAVRDHWLEYGIRENRMGSPAFDPMYYIAKYTDLTGENSQSALSHWLDTGLDLGRQASEAFDPVYYLAHNADLSNWYGPQNYQGAAQHWLGWGIDEGRQAAQNFSISAYLNRYPDLQQYLGPTNYRGALIHWFAHGKSEGRSAAP